ncbi:carbohydrate ABC transporter permease [Desertihabitans aurantiacus]|uniref:carbohydrate ABC transporter permease n=1 Tax=Desertihabitans aurantiacus TaxID=2282477 RepID=UPI000DF77AEC|nr:sugar ABC transporter permease [Desertihabitans aurantiacus]
MNSVLGDRRTIIILLGPALLLYTLVKVVPVAWSLGLSFFEGNSLRGFEFVGFANFVEFAGDDAALQSVLVTLRYALLATTSQVALGYALALLYVFVLRRGSAFLRTVVFFPMVLPGVATALLFRNLVAVGPNQGPVNDLLNLLGLDSVEFLASGDLTLATALVMNLWQSMGFYAVLLYAGLLDIPEETIESARLDGANGLRLVRHVVLPLSLPILLSSIIFSFNSTLKVFDGLLALNNGGPGTETSPLTLYMYRTAFEYAEYGYGSTIAFVLTLLCLVFTLAIFRSSRRKVED